MSFTEFDYFKQKVLRLTGINLDAYKREQVLRRLQVIMAKNNADGFLEYARMMERDPERINEFKDFFTINVSEFFRNPERFNELKEKILPALLKESWQLQIWSAGCSYGAEPYSIAIVLDELGASLRYSLLATDLDESALNKARRGVFVVDDLENVSQLRLKRYFIERDGTWQVKEDLKKNITFKKHDLLSDEYGHNYDLIVCRNVLIYFDEKAKQQVCKKLSEALRKGGILFVGGTESLFWASELGLSSIAPFFYKRVA